VTAALLWLAGLQRPQGAVPISAEAGAPHWPTGLAALAWLRCAGEDDAVHEGPASRAVDWLFEDRGRAVAPDDAIHDHDTTLVGWPWVPGTHSWIEPTAYALLALRAAGRADHPRVREGVELILDRALPEGGWNYGNRRVLGNLLRPFPATTGAALAALAGEPQDDRIAAATAYLTRELPRIRAPLSLAWGLIGLQAWNARPRDAGAWLTESALRLVDQPAAPHYDALLLLAGAESCCLTEVAEA
jgi:hypothetical protein